MTLLRSPLNWLVFFTIFAISLASCTYDLHKQFEIIRWFFLYSYLIFIIFGKGARKPFQAVDFFALIFIVPAFFSYTYSLEPTLTMQRAISVAIFYVSIFFGVWKAIDKMRTAENFSKSILFACISFIVAGIFIPDGWIHGRYRGLFYNPNQLALVVLFCMPISFSLYFQTKRRIYLAIFLLTVAVIALTGSRTALTGAVLGTAIFYNFLGVRKRILVWLFCLAFIAIFQLFPHYFEDLIVRTPIVRYETLEEAGGRTEAWEYGQELIKINPLLGLGFGAEDYILEHYPRQMKIHSGKHFHNVYLGMTLQMGYIGAILFFLPLAILVFKGFSNIRETMKKTGSYLPLGYFVCLCVGLWAGMFESHIYSAGNPTAFIFWSQIMLLYRMNKGKRRVVRRGMQST